MKESLKQVIQQSDHCIIAPCVYDCASARAVEMIGFQSMMLSGGEVSLAMNGLVDYGFNTLTELEWVVSRVSAANTLPLAVDIEGGFGGPLAVYHTCRRLVTAGASAVQLEDGCDMETSTRLLDREKYYAKVRAAVAALKGTDCMLIARTNADPATELDEGCERMKKAVEFGADMTTVVKLTNLKDAQYVAQRVPGWKMYPDVAGQDGLPEVTVDQIYPLGFVFMTMHYTLKAAMDGMLEHGRMNVKQQGCLYTADKKDATGIKGVSATPLFDPQGFMQLESEFTGVDKEFTIVGAHVNEFPVDFKKSDIKDRM